MALRRAALCLAVASAAAVSIGDKIPSAELHYGFPPEKIDLASRVAGKKVIVVGLPGAFTPTWSNRQVPGYIESADALKAIGIDEVIIYCVNDGAVMDAWSKDQGVAEHKLITMMGDPYSDLTSALGMDLSHPGPEGKGLIRRCKRFALYLDDGVIKVLRVAEKPDDPAGDDYPEVTLADAMIKAIKEVGKDEL